MKLPFLSFTAHSRRNLTHAQRRTVPEAAYFYYTIKGGVSTRFILQESYFFHTFRNIFSGVKPKAFFYFTYILHCAFSGRRISPLTRPAPPWPPAPYRPKTGTHHCRCIPPHDCPHNATQNPSWCFPPVCLFCTRDFPGKHSIAQSGYHKKDFQPFSQTFYAKSSVCYPSLLTPFAATFLGNQVFGSPPQRRISAENRRYSCRFSSRPLPVKMG